MSKQRPYQPWSNVKVTLFIHYSRTDVMHGDTGTFTIEMGSIHDFLQNMQWLPELGLLIGFQPRHKQILRENMGYIEGSGSMSLRWGFNMKMENEVKFKDVIEFGKYLRQHPDIAHALQVKIKEPGPLRPGSEPQF